MNDQFPRPGLRLRILGPLRLWRDGVELDPGPRQQAYLLALLLARAGQPISTTELIDLIWDEEVPASALNSIHKYVGVLRRLLEPELPLRGVGSYLLRRGDAYLFVAGPGMLDLVTFRELVAAAKTGQPDHQALDRYMEALKLWRGPAGKGRDHGPAAIPTFTALDGEFFEACAAAADLAVSLGQPERVLPHLQLAASMAPLHEAVQASFITTLAAAGHQAEALVAFHTVRTRLAEDLGIDPGHALQAAHQQVLSQAAGQAVAKAPTRRPPDPRAAAPALPRRDQAGLVGRVEELAVLRQAVEPALAGGTGLVIVEGEPGVGKTVLLEEAAAEAEQRGVLVVWGHCLDGDGTPSMWPWVQAIGTVLDGLPSATREESLSGELGRLMEPRVAVLAASAMPDSGAQFRLFEQVVAVIGQTSAQRPVLLVVDDLQWADVASLHLFSHLAGRLPRRTVIIGALRDRAPAPGSELSRTLAAASRVPSHHRIRLGPLDETDIAELVRRETGKYPSSETTRTIHARTAGNPFFVQELSRLLTDDGGVLTEDTARSGVPSTVHDIVRDRVTDLDHDTQRLLQTAAFIGRDVDLTLLAHAADLDVATCLNHLHPLDALGLLGPAPDNPFTFRFAHDLVRESVAETTPPPRSARMHLHIANALERIDPDGESAPERMAHHLWAAGPLADPARTVEALVRASRRAAAKSALAAAERHLRSAAQMARTAGLAELELSALSMLAAVVGMRSGYMPSALDLLERAEYLALGLGREREASEFLFTRRAGHSQAVQLEHSGRLARRLLEQGEASADPIVRAYGLHSWGIHQWDVGNIGEAYRYLSQLNQIMLDELAGHEENRLRHDLQLLSPVMLALMTAEYGDVGEARNVLDTVESAVGDDPFAITVWAAFATTVAALAGEPAWALRAAERGIAQDPEFTFVFYGAYLRLGQCWAQAMKGRNPAAAAAEAERLIAALLVDPPLSGVSNWYGLIGEMWLAAGMPDEAAVALDRAGYFLDLTGQRYAEGLLLLLRARLLQAHGEPATSIRAAAEKARALSIEREAHLFAHRADEFLARLEDESVSR